MLFQTLGADPASDHAVSSLVNAGVLMNKDCKVLGTLSIRGAIDPALIAMMRKMPAGSPHSPSPESEARWAAAASHPDAADLAKAKSFMQGFWLCMTSFEDDVRAVLHIRTVFIMRSRSLAAHLLL